MASWVDSLDLSKIGDEDRYRVLEYLVSKLGRDRVQEALGVSRITMWRLLNKQQKVDDSKLKALLSLMTEQEFREVLGARRALEALGVVRPDGTINYSVAVEILRLAANDEYLKHLILRFVVDNYREDLRKMLGISFAGVKLEWSSDFERFLSEGKRRRKVKDVDTLKYYKSLFTKYLQGKELTEQLIDYVVNHPNKWLRNVFRHYVQYLYYKRKISPETFGWIMEVVPSRSYRLTVRVFDVDLDLFKKTVDFLRERHELYYLYYLLMYYSGIRVEHVVKLVEEYDPDQIVYVDMVGRYSRRLVCFEDRGFCRYYAGYRGGKPCEWVYFPRELLQLLSEYRGEKRDRSSVSDYAKEHGLLPPKYLRKLNWQVLDRVIADKDVAKFIQSRLGEIEISEARYGNLLREADNWYPKAVEALKKGLESTDFLKQLFTS